MQMVSRVQWSFRTSPTPNARIPSTAAGSAALALVLCSAWTSTAAADTPDASRFRGGISAESGAMILRDSHKSLPTQTFPMVGLQGQLGLQLDHLVGLYLLPQLDSVFDQANVGVHVG